MARTSINPRCPYCRVRHSTSTTWRCKERDEEDVASATDALSTEVSTDQQAQYDAIHDHGDHHCLADPCVWHPGETRIRPVTWHSATLALDDETCPTACVEANHPGIEHSAWLAR